MVARAFTLSLEEYFKNAHHIHPPQTEAMIAGKKRHEEKFKDYLTLDEYGIDNFLKDFNEGKLISLKEVRICSKAYGFRGVIDFLTVRYDKRTNTIDIYVGEYKTRFDKKYLYQLAVYCMILSDLKAELIYEKTIKDKPYIIGKRFYPELPFYLNIHGSLTTASNYSFRREFMESNELTDFGHLYMMLVHKLSKEYRHVHHYGLYDLEGLKEKPKHVQRYIPKRITKNHHLNKTKPKVVKGYI